jgi:uncharacterized protein (DUF488 family)
MPTELYTIGYEGASQEAVLRCLVYNDIQTLVDIRELPQSRKPGLSKNALKSAAEEKDIRYIHIRALGTPRDIRYQRKIDHDQNAFEAGFLSYLSTQDEAIKALTNLAMESRSCLLCYESNPAICHRSLVANRLVERSNNSLAVVHLFPTMVEVSSPDITS